MVDCPAVTDLRTGDAESEKSEKKIAKETLAAWELLACAVPTVPVTVKFKGFALVAERPRTVTVLLCPAVIDAGSKAQVAPEEQESAISLTKELGAEAETVKVVEVVPITTVLDRALVEREKIVFPVPVSGTPWGLPAASSLMSRVPLRVPLPVAVNVTLTVQLAPTLRTLGRFPQVLVCAKSPLMLIAVRVTAILPLLVTRTT